ncbi:hypothetical protein MICRO8M_50111 [Microbacterium sp. 8M]|nr:hypothetical protein MICRO8M_50111 [Microbacterium sp. 8M]
MLVGFDRDGPSARPLKTCDPLGRSLDKALHHRYTGDHRGRFTSRPVTRRCPSTSRRDGRGFR